MSKYSYAYFSRVTTLQVKLNGFIAPSTGLEMLAYIAELERKAKVEEELPR